MNRRDFGKGVAAAATTAIGCEAEQPEAATAKVAQRAVTDVHTAQRKLEGAGFPVRRPFPTMQLRNVDPFVLLDEMGPKKWGPGEALGAPDHPHRGFETVSYILQGEVHHRDSQGGRGVLRGGDVQWMTAGGGIVHSEMPSPELKRTGGVVHGFQIWVNLPRRLKMTEPRYQEVTAATIPRGRTPDGLVEARVVTGEALGQKAKINTHTPIVYQHWTIQPGGAALQPIASDHNAMVYVFGGTMRVADTTVADGQLAILGAGDAVALSVDASASESAEMLLLGGVPHREPILQHGPFVMCTPDEIRQAYADYRAGRMGKITG